MVIRAAEGFLLYENRLPTIEEIERWLGDNHYVRGDSMLSAYPKLGECCGTYDGPELPPDWAFVLPEDLPKQFKPLLLCLDMLADKEWANEEIPKGLLEACREHEYRVTRRAKA